jgi:hypothetical protein
MSAFQMPTAELGDKVFYYRHEGAPPSLALVTEVSSRTLTLWVITPSYGGVERFSVHHVDDPGVNEFPAWKEYGFWAPRPSKLIALQEKLALAEKRLEALEAKKAK